jgi:hypothetical protein
MGVTVVTYGKACEMSDVLDSPILTGDRSFGRQAVPLYQVLNLDDMERAAVAELLWRYADYREGDLDFSTSQLAFELSLDPRYAYDPTATQEALERESSSIEQFVQKQVAAAEPFRELARQVEQTGQLDLTDEDTLHGVGEALDNTGWRLDGDPEDAPPQGIRRILAAVQAGSQPTLAPEVGAGVEPGRGTRWETVTAPTLGHPEEIAQPTRPSPGISI